MWMRKSRQVMLENEREIIFAIWWRDYILIGSLIDGSYMGVNGFMFIGDFYELTCVLRFYDTLLGDGYQTKAFKYLIKTKRNFF